MIDETLLLRLLPNGSMAAMVLFVLIAGIKYVKHLHRVHKDDKEAISAEHQRQITTLLANHKDERDRFAEILDRANDTNKDLQSSHRALLEQSLKTNTEVTLALKAVEDAIRQNLERSTRARNVNQEKQ